VGGRLEEALGARAASHRVVEPRGHGAPRLDGLRVLVAEDNHVNQKVVLAQLKAMGCHADAVADGREAVAAIARATYDLVLMDCQMPAMDGFEATASIRAVEQGRRAPPITPTTHGLPADR